MLQSTSQGSLTKSSYSVKTCGCCGINRLIGQHGDTPTCTRSAHLVSVCSGPFRMREHELFEKLPEPFSKNITAAFNLKTETKEVMLFSQQEEGEGAMKRMVSMYLSWNMDENVVVDGPYKVSDKSKPLNLPPQFHTRIDAALNRRAESSSVMLFSGSTWVEFDYATNVVTHGPYLISQHPLFQPISDALSLCSGYDLNRLGNLTQNLQILRPVPRGSVHWIAGTGAGGFADSNGKPAVPLPTTDGRTVPDDSDDEEGMGGEQVMFNAPNAMAVVGGDTAYIADTINNAIRRVDLASGNTTTIAGGGAVYGGFMDGQGTTARFNRPLGISAMRLDKLGDVLYVADADNHAVRRIAVPRNPPYDAITVTVTGAFADTIFDLVCAESCCQVEAPVAVPIAHSIQAPLGVLRAANVRFTGFKTGAVMMANYTSRAELRLYTTKLQLVQQRMNLYTSQTSSITRSEGL